MTVTPNVFLIGAPKCGTTAMMQYLGEHPNVFTSVPKEPFYWCPDFARSRHEPKFDGLDDYLALFAEADPAQHKVVMEGSTRYLQSVEAIPAILAFNPQARFIAMVRDPVEVAQAYHMEQRFSLHEDVEDFRTAWNLQDQRAAGQQIPATCGEPEAAAIPRGRGLRRAGDARRRADPRGAVPCHRLRGLQDRHRRAVPPGAGLPWAG